MSRVSLEAAAPGRHFTPDGHLIGSIGEVLAAARYGLTLTTASTKGIDVHDADGRSVEIKATTGRKGVALRGFEPLADHLIVVTIDATNGAMAEVYDGPASAIQGDGQGQPGAGVNRRSSGSIIRRMNSMNQGSYP